MRHYYRREFVGFDESLQDYVLPDAFTASVLRVGATVKSGGTVTSGGSGGVTVEHPGRLTEGDKIRVVNRDTPTVQSQRLEITALSYSAGWSITLFDIDTGGTYVVNAGDRLVIEPSGSTAPYAVLYDDDTSNARAVTNPIVSGAVTSPRDAVIEFYTNEHDVDVKIVSGSDILYIMDSETGGQNLEVNVEEWGAIGDDSTDNIEAITAAINHAVESTQKRVIRVPSGIYQISSPIELNSSNLSVICDRNVTIKKHSSWAFPGSQDALVRFSAIKCSWTGGELEPDGTTSSVYTTAAASKTVLDTVVCTNGANGVSMLAGPDNLSLYDCKFVGQTTAGINSTGSDGMLVSRCRFLDGTGSGIVIVNTSGVTNNLRVADCLFSGLGAIGISVSSATASLVMRPRVSECVFEDIEFWACLFTNVTAPRVTDCSFDSCGGTNGGTPDGYDAVSLLSCNYGRVDSCDGAIINGCGVRIDTEPAEAVPLGNRVSDCNFTACQEQGVYAVTGGGHTISDNYAKGNSLTTGPTYDIEVEGAVSDSVFVDNTTGVGKLFIDPTNDATNEIAHNNESSL